MKNKQAVARVATGLAVVGLIVGLFGWYEGWFGGSSEAMASQKGGGKSGQPPAAKVTVAKPLVMPIVEWDEYVGRMAAVESVEVRARVGGQLNARFFLEGDMVTKGDLLFQIDPRPFEATLAEANATLAEAKSAVTQAIAAKAESQANREQVIAKRELATKQLERLKGLVQQRAISQDEFDIQKSEEQQTVADLAAAEAAINSAEARKVSAEASVKFATATVKMAKLNLSFTRIAAPISGRIGQAFATEGNLIVGGDLNTTLLTTIVSTDPIHCYFDANERELLKYVRLDRSGDRESSRNVKNPVYLSLIDEEGYPHKGHMDFVDNRIDSNTGTIRGRAIFPNDDKILAPGMFGKLRLPGSGSYEATLIPDSAIGLDQSERYVVVVKPDNSTERRTIELGPISHGLRIIRKGVQPDDLIVVHGLQRIRPGVKVSPEEEEIVATDDEGLPDSYEPVPKDKWLSAQKSPPKKPSMMTEPNSMMAEPTRQWSNRTR